MIECGCNGFLKIGRNTHINGGIRLSCQESIIIGKSNLWSWDVSIFDSDFHRMKKSSSNAKIESCSAPIIIGDNCWIGFVTVILKGSKLGLKCILGAKSVLTKDFSLCKNQILAGNPAIPRKEGYYLDINDC